MEVDLVVSFLNYLDVVSKKKSAFKNLYQDTYHT